MRRKIDFKDTFEIMDRPMDKKDMENIAHKAIDDVENLRKS